MHWIIKATIVAIIAICCLILIEIAHQREAARVPGAPPYTAAPH